MAMHFSSIIGKEEYTRGDRLQAQQRRIDHGHELVGLDNEGALKAYGTAAFHLRQFKEELVAERSGGKFDRIFSSVSSALTTAEAGFKNVKAFLEDNEHKSQELAHERRD